MVDHIKILLLNPDDRDDYLKVKDPVVDSVLALFGVNGTLTDEAVVDSVLPLAMAPDLAEFREFFDSRVSPVRDTGSVYRHNYAEAGGSLDGLYERVLGQDGWYKVSGLFVSDDQVVGQNLIRMRESASSPDSVYALGAVLLACAYRRLTSTSHYSK